MPAHPWARPPSRSAGGLVEVLSGGSGAPSIRWIMPPRSPARLRDRTAAADGASTPRGSTSLTTGWRATYSTGCWPRAWPAPSRLRPAGDEAGTGALSVERSRGEAASPPRSYTPCSTYPSARSSNDHQVRSPAFRLSGETNYHRAVAIDPLSCLPRHLRTFDSGGQSMTPDTPRARALPLPPLRATESPPDPFVQSVERHRDLGVLVVVGPADQQRP